MKKYLILALLVAGVFASYWVAFGNPFKKAVAEPETPGDETGSVAQASEKIPATGKDTRGFPLSQGSTGEYVKMLQTALNSRYGSNLVVDGIFGLKTAKAVGAHGFNAEAIYYNHFNQILGYQYWK